MSLPWDEQLRSEHISLVASTAAYMHLSAATAAEKQCCCQAILYQHLFSPSTFANFISSFKLIARKRQQVQLVTYTISICLPFIAHGFYY